MPLQGDHIAGHGRFVRTQKMRYPLYGTVELGLAGGRTSKMPLQT